MFETGAHLEGKRRATRERLNDRGVSSLTRAEISAFAGNSAWNSKMGLGWTL